MKTLTPYEKFVALDKEQDKIMGKMDAKMATPSDRMRLEIIEEEKMMLKSKIRGTKAEVRLRQEGVW